MKKIFHFSIALILANVSLAQKSGGVSFADTIQVDSSEYFIIPHHLESDDKQEYGKGKGFFMWGAYTEVSFFNSLTNEVHNIFEGKKVLISAFRERYFGYREESPVEKLPNFLPNHILYMVRSSDYNKDGALDSEDPVYIYVTDKKGKGLRQITPDGFNVLSFKVSTNGKTVMVRAQKDVDGNKKFRPGDEQVYFKLEMNTDIEKIKCLPINIQSK